jgi:PTH1 family peptidyl-tRNA hydrolase
MSDKICLVVGLGNPGQEYENTRHNIGFRVVDQTARHYSIALSKERWGTVYGRGKIEGLDVLLAKPLKFMNRSGMPIYELSSYLGLDPKNMVVIHDDMDLEFGRIKVKEKGGHGGHNGVKSLMEAFGGGDFIRLRMGIGRPENADRVTEYVLGRFGTTRREEVDAFVERGRDALAAILCKGAKESMNVFNRKTSIS